jgi:hypothetical protein
MVQRRSVRLGVHVCSVVGAAIDRQTGEIRRRTKTPDHRELAAWIRSLPEGVKVVYGLGRQVSGWPGSCAAGVECIVVAPSKLRRPADDRVKRRCPGSAAGPVRTCSEFGCLRGARDRGDLVRSGAGIRARGIAGETAISGHRPVGAA